MDKKVGSEKTEFVKEEAAQKDEYILQKNTITKTATYIIIAFLVLIGLGLVISQYFLAS